MHQHLPSTFESSEPVASPIPRFLAPLSGWPLEHLVLLDHHRPGLLAQMMSSRARRRQAVFAALAMGAMDRPQEFARLLGEDGCGWHGAVWPALLAEAFVMARPERIAEVAFGGRYAGLMGACERAGLEPLDRASYARLHSIYADPLEVRRQRMISATLRLNATKLSILERLPDCALHANVLMVCRKPEDAEFLRMVIDLALQHTPKGQAEVYKALSDLGRFSRVEYLAERLLKTFTSTDAQPDVSGVAGAKVLDTGRKLKAAAFEFHNCMSNGKNLYGVVSGEVAFVTLGQPNVVMQLQSLAGADWVITGIYSPNNDDVPQAAREAACIAFEEAGFPVVSSVARTEDRERVAERLRTGWFGFDVEAA